MAALHLGELGISISLHISFDQSISWGRGLDWNEPDQRNHNKCGMAEHWLEGNKKPSQKVYVCRLFWHGLITDETRLHSLFKRDNGICWHRRRCRRGAALATLLQHHHRPAAAAVSGDPNTMAMFLLAAPWSIYPCPEHAASMLLLSTQGGTRLV